LQKNQNQRTLEHGISRRVLQRLESHSVHQPGRQFLGLHFRPNPESTRSAADSVRLEVLVLKNRLDSPRAIFETSRLTAGNRPAHHGALPCTTHYAGNSPPTKSARPNPPRPISALSNASRSASPATIATTSRIPSSCGTAKAAAFTILTATSTLTTTSASAHSWPAIATPPSSRPSSRNFMRAPRSACRTTRNGNLPKKSANAIPWKWFASARAARKSPCPRCASPEPPKNATKSSNSKALTTASTTPLSSASSPRKPT